MKKLFIMTCLLLQAITTQALPVIDEIVPTGGEPVKVYPDHKRPGVYWYIPLSVEPVSPNSPYKSAMNYSPGKSFTLIFRGQPTVDKSTLQTVAKSLGTTIDNLTPIAYEKTGNLVCQNVFMSPDLQWQFASKIGSYLEIVPVSIHTRDGELADTLYDITTAGGLACTVDVFFKAVSTGYALTIEADLNEVYKQFEMNAHAEGLWWEVDIHVLLQDLYNKKVIRISKIEDSSYSKTPLDKQVKAAWDEISRKIIEELFRQALKLPNEPIVGRGKAWSLRVDYKKSEVNKHFIATLEGKAIQVKESLIGLRLADR